MRKDRIIRCRCLTTTGAPCQQPVAKGTLFCSQHQKCKGSPLSGAEPLWNPDRYNNDPLIQATHNCWAYGMDVIDPAQLTQCVGKPKGCRLMYHQPGGTKNLSSELHTDSGRRCVVVEKLMMADEPELSPTTFDAKCPEGFSKIAMVVDPGDDYHFYRQDSNGLWSHKDGANPAKRYDADGQLIWDPRTAARDYRPRSYLNYTDFCGYYCAPRRKTVRLARDNSIRGGSRRVRS